MYKTLCFIALFWIGLHPVLAQDTSKRQQELEAQRTQFPSIKGIGHFPKAVQKLFGYRVGDHPLANIFVV